MIQGLRKQRHAASWLLAGWLIAGSQPSLAADQPFGIKDDNLGMAYSEFVARYDRPASGDDRAPCCSDKRPKGMYLQTDPPIPGVVGCMTEYPYEQHDPNRYSIWRGFKPRTTMAGVPARLVYRFISSGPDADVTGSAPLFLIWGDFASSDFDTVSAAFTTKYGAPKLIDTKTYQNAFGATFSGRIVRWESKSAYINLSEFGTSKDFSQLEIGDTALMAEAGRRYLQVKAEAAASDL